MSREVSNSRIMIAEAIGTAILMLGGPGVAILGINDSSAGGLLAVALGFGFALLVASYAVGHVSGCHVNPAVTVGLWLSKKLDSSKLFSYIAGQVIGAAAGGFLIWLMAHAARGTFDANPSNFAANLWIDGDRFYGFWAMVIAEIVFTALLVFVVLSTTRRHYAAPVVGLHAGITLALIHMVGIPIDNTSVNPARSFGTALFAAGDAIEQLWAFVLFPLIGAAVGAGLWRAVQGDGIDDNEAVQAWADQASAATPAPGLDPATHPFGEGSHAALADGSQPGGYDIKGNADSMLYHRPDSRSYRATRPEVWFDSTASAEAAGFQLAPTHPAD